MARSFGRGEPVELGDDRANVQEELVAQTRRYKIGSMSLAKIAGADKFLVGSAVIIIHVRKPPLKVMSVKGFHFAIVEDRQ
jgi:hypothetical protein